MKILLLLLLISCGNEEQQTNSHNQSNGDPAFDPYIGQVISDHRRFGGVPPNGFTVRFNTFVDIGRCDHNSKVIDIHPGQWAYASEVKRYLIIAHEYGHCYLNRSHVAIYRDHVPMSIMDRNIINETVFLRNQAYYLEELYR